VNIIHAKFQREVPNNYTGIVEWFDGEKWCYKNGSLHREDGPACIFYNGIKK